MSNIQFSQKELTLLLKGGNKLLDVPLIQKLLCTQEIIPLTSKGEPLICGKFRRSLRKGRTFVTVNLMINVRGPDDNEFIRHPILAKLCPRSRSETLVFNVAGDLVYRFGLTNFRKFFAKKTAEEDETPAGGFAIAEHASFETGIPPDAVKRWVWTLKSNGKQFTMRIINIEGKLYFTGGSKNSHETVLIAESIAEQIKLNACIKENALVYDILSLFIGHWFAMSPEQKTVIIDTCEKGYSLCGEFEDGKHLTETPTGKPQLTFFGRAEISDEETLCDNIVDTCEFFKGLGLNTVPYKVFNTREELIAAQNEARFLTKTEGGVIHYQVLRDGKWNTYALEKFKTFWYSLIRAMREWMKNVDVKKLDLITELPKLAKRIDTHDSNWMSLPAKYKASWITSTANFIKWFVNSRFSASSVGFMEEGVGMASLWEQFLDETGESDDFLRRDIFAQRVGNLSDMKELLVMAGCASSSELKTIDKQIVALKTRFDSKVNALIREHVSIEASKTKAKEEAKAKQEAKGKAKQEAKGKAKQEAKEEANAKADSSSEQKDMDVDDVCLLPPQPNPLLVPVTEYVSGLDDEATILMLDIYRSGQEAKAMAKQEANVMAKQEANAKADSSSEQKDMDVDDVCLLPPQPRLLLVPVTEYISGLDE